MKVLLFTAVLFCVSSSFGQTFNYTDTAFVVGAIRIVETYPLSTKWYELEKKRIEKTYDSLATFLNGHPNLTVEMGFYENTRGSEEYNDQYTAKMAQYALEQLTKRDVKPKQITAVGHGERRPIYSDTYIYRLESETDKEAAHEANRRVELKIVKID